MRLRSRRSATRSHTNRISIRNLHSRNLSAFGAALSRGKLGVLIQRVVTKDFDGFLGRDFTARDALMHGLRFWGRHIALVLEAADDARGIARFFGCRTGV